MGPAIVLVTFIFFAVPCLVFVYAFMRASCLIKERYAKLGGDKKLSWIEKIMLDVLNFCDSCKEGCTNHKRLVRRAIFFAFVIALLLTIIYHIR